MTSAQDEQPAEPTPERLTVGATGTVLGIGAAVLVGVLSVLGIAGDVLGRLVRTYPWWMVTFLIVAVAGTHPSPSGSVP